MTILSKGKNEVNKMRKLRDKKPATVVINIDGITRACLEDIDAHFHYLQIFLNEGLYVENVETGEFIKSNEIAKVRDVLSSLLEVEYFHFKICSAIPIIGDKQNN